MSALKDQQFCLGSPENAPARPRRPSPAGAAACSWGSSVLLEPSWQPMTLLTREIVPAECWPCAAQACAHSCAQVWRTKLRTKYIVTNGFGKPLRLESDKHEEEQNRGLKQELKSLMREMEERQENGKVWPLFCFLRLP